MQSFSIKKDISYTKMEYSEWFDYSGIEFPQKIELVLNVKKLEIGINDGSALGVMFQQTIDEVIIGDLAFQAVNLNDNAEISQEIQTITLENKDGVLLGNKGRFRFFLSQSNPNGVPSKASFEAAVLVK